MATCCSGARNGPRDGGETAGGQFMIPCELNTEMPTVWTHACLRLRANGNAVKEPTRTKPGDVSFSRSSRTAKTLSASRPESPSNYGNEDCCG